MAVIELGVVSRNMRHAGTKSRGFRSCAKSTVGGMIRTDRPFPTLNSQFAFTACNPTTNPTSSPPTLILGPSSTPDGMVNIPNVETDTFHVFLP